MRHLLLLRTEARALGIVAELLLAERVLVVDDLVGLPDGLRGEEPVHALEGDTCAATPSATNTRTGSP